MYYTDIELHEKLYCLEKEMENLREIPKCILSDQEIKTLAIEEEMITPFESKSIKKEIISYGLSSFGYDLRVRNHFKKPRKGALIDPKKPREVDWEELTLDNDGTIIIPPHEFFLAESVEKFRMPDNVLGVVYGKSTYARCGIVTNVTPLEPGWEGTVTLEISNTTNNPVVLYPYEGLCQVVFFQGNFPDVNYRTKGGKYQHQKGITLGGV